MKERVKTGRYILTQRIGKLGSSLAGEHPTLLLMIGVRIAARKS